MLDIDFEIIALPIFSVMSIQFIGMDFIHYGSILTGNSNFARHQNPRLDFD
jgi:hypothetical protein